jgi:Uma2 family endonuclease
LPNGAVRSPNAAWIRQEGWDALTLQQQRKFPPIAPDFVIELRSELDKLETLRVKMWEYMENDVLLGWLINPQDQQVEIYRQEQSVELLDSPEILSGEELLPGFSLELDRIFN